MQKGSKTGGYLLQYTYNNWITLNAQFSKFCQHVLRANVCKNGAGGNSLRHGFSWLFGRQHISQNINGQKFKMAEIYSHF